ncbi:MAG: response regulator [Myxococcales bacterium]
MNRHHVLVVEDDEEIRETVIEVLEDHGLPALGAENGRAALNLLAGAASLPCLILLDLMMPVMDGRTFRAHQLNDSRLATIPVVVFSANRDAGSHAEELRVNRILPKPVKLNELLTIAREICVDAPQPA